MSHSKRNTSLAFFTNHERSQLKDRWGSQKARLTRESFLPLAACHLCLQTAREPVACRDGGHIFCRECAVTNLLTQRKEIERLQREDERRREDDKENEKDKADEAQQEVVRGFERTLMGLEPDDRNTTKRKFDTESSNTVDERSRIRRKLDDDKNTPSEQNFWMPAANETAGDDGSKRSRKLQPTCPSASSKDTHPFSLKSLVTVNFTTSASSSNNSDANTAVTDVGGHSAAITCPACKKGLSASSKAVLTVPCGHVICKPCVDKFMKVTNPVSVGKHSVPLDTDDPLVCYVCQTDLTKQTKDKKKEGKSSKEKEKVRPGLVELASSGTGFASGGKAVVDKEGLAFQC